MQEGITGYLAHAVRGLAGDTASKDDIDRNIAHAKCHAAIIREIVPGIRLYVPHEHEALYQRVWQGVLDEEERAWISRQILQQCLDILGLCRWLFVTGHPRKSAGVQLETQFALEHGHGIVPLWTVQVERWRGMILSCGVLGRNQGLADAAKAV